MPLSPIETVQFKDTGKPKRLSCHEGRWYLDVVRLVALERNLFEPHTQRLEGPDAVLGFLKRSPDGHPLLGRTEELMGSVGGDARSFENVDGQWVPTSISPEYVKQLTTKRGAAQEASATELAQVRAELLLLRASHARLTDRVSALEKSLSRIQGGAVILGAPTRDVAIAQSDAPGIGASSAGDKAPSVGAVGKEPTGRVEHPPADSRATHPRETEAVPARPASGYKDPLPPGISGIRLPTTAQVLECARVLLGNEVDLQKKPLSVDYFQDLESFWYCKMLDDSEREVGVLMADLTATVRLGGALMMLPDSEVQQLLASGAPSEDAIAAMSEVFSNICGVIAGLEGNKHIRSTYLEAYSLTHVPWVQATKDVVQLADNFGGTMLLIARHVPG